LAFVDSRLKENPTTTMTDLLQDRQEQLVFEGLLGHRDSTRPLREAVAAFLHETASRENYWWRLREARSHLAVDSDGHLTIRISWKAWIDAGLFALLGIFMFPVGENCRNESRLSFGIAPSRNPRPVPALDARRSAAAIR
jgi:hypothetical protein